MRFGRSYNSLNDNTLAVWEYYFTQQFCITEYFFMYVVSAGTYDYWFVFISTVTQFWKLFPFEKYAEYFSLWHICNTFVRKNLRKTESMLFMHFGANEVDCKAFIETYEKFTRDRFYVPKISLWKFSIKQQRSLMCTRKFECNFGEDILLYKI